MLSYLDLSSTDKAIAPRSPAEILTAIRPDEEPLFNSDIHVKRMPAATNNMKNEMVKADVFCGNSEQNRFKKVAQPLVMLNLNVCATLKSARHIWIKNQTNGFKAQVFKMSEKNFRTDFIQLSLGTNKLLIESVLKDGQKRVQSLEIISGS